MAGQAAYFDASRSETAIRLGFLNTVTIRNLTLNNPIAAISEAGNSSIMTFNNLDVSGTDGIAGFGLNLSWGFTSYTLTDITANNRGTGVYLKGYGPTITNPRPTAAALVSATTRTATPPRPSTASSCGTTTSRCSSIAGRR